MKESAKRERARRAMELLKAMLRGGMLGSDPETVWAIEDLWEFVEGDVMESDVMESDVMAINKPTIQVLILVLDSVDAVNKVISALPDGCCLAVITDTNPLRAADSLKSQALANGCPPCP